MEFIHISLADYLFVCLCFIDFHINSKNRANQNKLQNKENKANAKRGLTCCPQDSYKQLAGNGFKFTDPCSLTMGSS